MDMQMTQRTGSDRVEWVFRAHNFGCSLVYPTYVEPLTDENYEVAK